MIHVAIPPYNISAFRIGFYISNETLRYTMILFILICQQWLERTKKKTIYECIACYFFSFLSHGYWILLRAREEKQIMEKSGRNRKKMGDKGVVMTTATVDYKLTVLNDEQERAKKSFGRNFISEYFFAKKGIKNRNAYYMDDFRLDFLCWQQLP